MAEADRLLPNPPTEEAPRQKATLKKTRRGR
jgi:hypothetical protein